ncbi:MAG TPA: type VI secretion system tip protein TssI/VgrG [Candidatus Binatia bacterium]|nr:type VI secretion system tip protein TssI/VgrG [Candidatus Binatia bacterium]
MPETQGDQFISLTTPLGDDVLLLQKLTGHEGISQLFNFRLELASEKAPIGLESIIGQPVTVSMTLSDGSKRYFNGFASQFGQTGQDAQAIYYYAEMVPWLWFLSQTSDCRIFQNKTVPEIVTQILQEFGFRDFRSALQGTYERQDVLMQYCETDFDFISRLMEQVGIFYFFEHGQGKHTLVLADNPAAHPVVPVTPRLAFQPAAGSGGRGDVVTRLALRREWRPGKYAMNDYNFEVPSMNLVATSESAPEVGGNRRYELYEHPGDYREKTRGEVLARIRMQEIESTSQIFNGTSAGRGMSAGYRFALVGHPRQDLNQTYVITALQHEAELTAAGAEIYTNQFMAIPHSVPFRPLRLTPQPIVRGLETGVVVGPKGEEIFVDEYGRVKVQFHWDRQGKNDENSSGWIRVAQPWAGKQRGTFFVPRIGDEVLIDFLHGDLRRPTVVGSVYNGEDKPPVSLPAGQTITTIKSSSTKGGGGSNELRFEDKKGSEEIYLHGQKDARTVIEHDQYEAIGNNKTLNVGNNRSETIGKAQALTIGAAYQLTVGTTLNERIGSDKQIAVGGALSETVGKDLRLNIGTDGRLIVGRKFSLAAGNGITIEAQKSISISAGDELTINCGQASIVLQKNGDISITGKEVSVKASGNIVLKGQKILEN